MVVVSSNTLAYNGLRLCDGAVIANRQLSFVPKLNRITKVQHLILSRTIAKPLIELNLR
jgi:hypothetical protein